MIAKQRQFLNSIWTLAERAGDRMTEEARMVAPAFPDNRYDALKFVGDLLRLRQKDWHALARAA